MDNRGPIIVVGTGRCGSTILHRLLSEHPRVAWLPGALCRRFPGRPRLQNLFNRGLDYPVVGKVLSEGITPGECYPFWEHYCRGFSAPYRDLMASDVTEKAKRRVRSAMSQVTTEKRDRLLLKITGWPRIGFLSEIFEGARFVHVVRDARAVVNSQLDTGFWNGWGGPGNWSWGELSPDQKEEWDSYGQSFVVLAAIQWKILIDAMENARKRIDEDHFLEVRYEDLCCASVDEVKRITRFCELEWTADFEQRLRKHRLVLANDKFKRDLSAKQLRDLEAVLEGYLRKYDYL